MIGIVNGHSAHKQSGILGDDKNGLGIRSGNKLMSRYGKCSSSSLRAVRQESYDECVGSPLLGGTG